MAANATVVIVISVAANPSVSHTAALGRRAKIRATPKTKTAIVNKKSPMTADTVFYSQYNFSS